MNKLSQHRDTYKQALRSGDSKALLQEKAWLTAAAASALLNQDIQAMQQVRACCADLSSLADHFDNTGKPGDRWRTLGDVLTLALGSGRPLEQLRLALPTTVSGLILKRIKDQPGITPTELSQHCDKKPNHIANEVKKLENAGLIDRLKRGNKHELFLSILGKEALDTVNPQKAPIQQGAFMDCKHADRNRLKKITESGNPLLPFNQAA
ncbi:MAG: winged helix-turn-helix transcriptional regulator [Methylobacter sp.]|nr:winged helix-turn-helix transcriptional regulator [Methylobacter sp.]